MSLTKSLTKSNTSSLLSTTQGVNYADALPDGATLDVFYPLRSDLKDTVSGADMTLTRASDVVYQNNLGEWVSKADDLPAVTGVSTLVQGAITNLVLWSEDMTNAAYNPIGSPTVTVNSIERTATSATYVRQVITKAASAIKYYATFTAEKVDSDFAVFRAQGSYPSRVDLCYQFSTDTFSIATATGSFTLHDYSVEPYPDGGVYICCSFTTDTNTNFQLIRTVSSKSMQVDGTDDISTGTLITDRLQVTTVYTPTYIKSEGTAGVQALTDLQADSSGWAVNDNAIYAYISGVRLNSGADQDIFETAVDGSNGVRLFNPSGTNDLTFRQEVATVNSDSTVTPTSTTEFEFLIQKDSVGGTIFEVTGDSDTQASYTADLEVGSTMQMMNNLALSAAANGYEAEFKYISKPVGTTITLAQARIAV